MITKVIELDDKSYEKVNDLVEDAISCICDIFETDNILKHKKTIESNIQKLVEFLNSKCTKNESVKPLKSKVEKESDDGFEEFEYLEKVCKSDPDNFDGVDEINHII